MASYYVRSGASGTGDGSSWTNAFTTLTAALSGKAAGDIFYVSEDHAELTASAVTLTFPGTQPAPNQVICVNHSGSVPPVSADLRTTGSIATSGANALSLGAGYAYFYGLTFSCGTGASTASMTIGSVASYGYKFENCLLMLGHTNTSGRVNFGSANAYPSGGITLLNTAVKFSAVQACTITDGQLTWRNTSPAFVLGTAPALMFSASTQFSYCLLEGIDLSNVSGLKLFAQVTGIVRSQLVNCKLPASFIYTSVPANLGQIYDLIVSDSSGTTARQERYAYGGTLTTESTDVRSGGANDSVQNFSWKVVTSANNTPQFPFECFPIDIWNNTVGSTVNVNVEILNDGTTLQNSDIWAEAIYLGNSGNPQELYATSAPADPLAAGTSISSSSASWTTTGLTTPIAQRITLSFTPQLKGYIRVYVKIAKVSKTIWVDPAAYLS